MYYTGIDPRTKRPVYIPDNPHEKAMQRALIQYRNPENYKLIREALIKAGREDLIGFDRHCLIRPKGSDKKDTGYKAPAGRVQKPKKKKTIRNIHKKKA